MSDHKTYFGEHVGHMYKEEVNWAEFLGMKVKNMAKRVMQSIGG